MSEDSTIAVEAPFWNRRLTLNAEYLMLFLSEPAFPADLLTLLKRALSSILEHGSEASMPEAARKAIP